ncbi:MAG: hypothetical protein LBK72_02730 [Bifidobacteriaceae bacterium]|nr:hypothetical protein [Bifidobacteriaceae bacterium]
MTATAPRTLDFFDRYVGALIAERYGYSPLDALRQFTRSETYRMLADDDLKIWYFSSLAVFDIWETERATGDPRDSVYLAV